MILKNWNLKRIHKASGPPSITSRLSRFRYHVQFHFKTKLIMIKFQNVSKYYQNGFQAIFILPGWILFVCAKACQNGICAKRRKRVNQFMLVIGQHLDFVRFTILSPLSRTQFDINENLFINLYNDEKSDQNLNFGTSIILSQYGCCQFDITVKFLANEKVFNVLLRKTNKIRIKFPSSWKMKTNLKFFIPYLFN